MKRISIEDLFTERLIKRAQDDHIPGTPVTSPDSNDEVPYEREMANKGDAQVPVLTDDVQEDLNGRIASFVNEGIYNFEDRLESDLEELENIVADPIKLKEADELCRLAVEALDKLARAVSAWSTWKE